MADSAPKSVASSSESAVHIVYTERPLENEEPEAYHIRTLASVLGSDEAAKGALIYSYKTAASGFSAKLTPQQVEEISSQSSLSSLRRNYLNMLVRVFWFFLGFMMTILPVIGKSYLFI
ncbi:unnamed protein product [Prunus armeniaca]|uniref:Inhibitor I9 domain-containing protein n=1 Tax=Prunus armeniaca TaxID=36596 RepID=A0A6J5VNV6_PRUAR|nr:unnamed protein product [Prunus armeniaca]